ncbi:MAG: hypothetical protein K9G83_12525, partial [Hyphomonadaceae bacterium]|nr:hypothetical protein [Hyphomonadaceae bacterium]
SVAAMRAASASTCFQLERLMAFSLARSGIPDDVAPSMPLASPDCSGLAIELFAAGRQCA